MSTKPDQVQFTYTTRQTASVNLAKTFTQSFVGGMMPPAMFFDPITAPAETVSGGELLLKVSTVLPGGVELSAERDDLRVLGTNPPRADVQAAVQAAIVPSDASLTIWLQKIACHETSQRQFATATRMAEFRVEGEPLMNGIGDGGFGIMQISKPPNELPNDQRFELLWNWRKNVQKGVDVFKAEKIPGAANYPASLRSDNDVAATVARTNVHRQGQALPPLAEIRIRDFARSGTLGDELIEDAVRGYNGYAGTDQFGRRLHEFRLRTIGVGVNMIFDYTNVRTEGGQLVADAIWERVPVSDRPVYPSRNYVEMVRVVNPTCP